MSNPQLYSKLILPIDDTAASPSIQVGGSSVASSGTGIYGDSANIKFAIAGSLIASVTASGITGSISGTANKATNIVGGLGGSIPYQSAVDTTAMLANGTSGQVLASQGTTVAPHWVSLPSILVLTSAAGAGGGATEAMTVTGLLTSDTILSVTQSTPGANSLPLIGFSTQATNALTGIWSADPGAGSIIKVAIKR